MNLCRSCEQDFGSVRAFDAHRVGRHAYTFAEGQRMEPPRADGRRCLSVAEMEAEGFVRNGRERWSLATDLVAARNVSERNPSREKAA